MISKIKLRAVGDYLQHAGAWFQITLLALVSLLPLFAPATAWAAPALQNREAQITTSKPGAVFDITFKFDTTNISSDVERIEIEFCDAPLGTCDTDNIPTIPASSTISQSGWDDSPEFDNYTRDDGDSGGTNNQIEVSRTNTADEGNKTDLTIGFTGLTNNATPNISYFPRIRLYDAASGGTLVWEGVVAQSTSEQLTVNARVQEILQFCTGTRNTPAPTDCSGMSGSTIDIGIIESSAVAISPVDVSDGGNDMNGAAMLRTNAVNGAVITYFAEQDTGSGQLKVPGATCSGSSTTDQCFNSSQTIAPFIAGTEAFGMTISSIDSSSGSTTNLVKAANYNGDGSAGGGFAWNDAANPVTLASSATSLVKVVDDEMLVLRFAATAATTTPTGQYTVTSTYIATATY